MSVQDVHAFFARLGEDKALMEKVLKTGEELKEKLNTGEENTEDALNSSFALIEPIARDEGLSFTLSDLRAAVDEGLKLNETELDNLTGAGGYISGDVCILYGAQIGTGDFRCFIGGASVYSDTREIACMCILVGGGGSS